MDMIGGTDKESDSYAKEEDSEKFDASSAKKEASKALIRGVKNGDWKAVNEAMEAHYEACMAEHETVD